MATLAQGGMPPNAQAQLNGIVAKDAEKNVVPVHTFNPDATPQQKAASAAQGMDKLKSVKEDGNADAGAKGAIRALLNPSLALTLSQPSPSMQGTVVSCPQSP